jgi:hypothetical protein
VSGTVKVKAHTRKLPKGKRKAAKAKPRKAKPAQLGLF